MKYAPLLIVFFVLIFKADAQKRPVVPVDVYRFQNISDAHVSPDGSWVCYVLATVDSVKYKRNDDIGMISWDGKQNVQLTKTPDVESSPRWSPDNKYISFLCFF